MINLNNFNTIEVKVALQCARKEVLKLEEMLVDGFGWNKMERTSIKEEHNQWQRHVANLTTHLNDKL